MLRVLTTTLFILCCELSSFARAQDVPFAAHSQLAVSAERLFGVAWTRTSSDKGKAETTTSINRVAAVAKALVSTYSAPRLALDWFVRDGLSVGLAVSYYQSSTEPPSEVSGNYHGLLAAPRIGYAYAFDSVVALWLRAGVTYQHVWTPAENGRRGLTLDQLACTIELPLVIMPLPHIAVLVGPTLDLGLVGSVSSGTQKLSNISTELALQAGLLLYL